MGRGRGRGRRRPSAGPFYLEPLEDRQLLSGVGPPPASPGMVSAGPGTGAFPAAVRTDTPPLSPLAPDGSAADTGETYPSAPGQQPVSGGAPSAAAKTYPQTTSQGTAPAGPDTSTTDPTPGDDSSAAGSTAGGQPTPTAPYTAVAFDPGMADHGPASPAQQTYPPPESSARPYPAYQVSGDATAQPYDLYRVSEPRPAGPVVPPPALAGPQPPGPPAPAAQAPGPTAEPPGPSQPGRGAAEPTAVARPQKESGAVERVSPLLALEVAEGATGEVAEGQAEASPPAPPAGGGPSGLAPQLGALLAGALPVDLPALERAADDFFTRLEGLAEEGPASPDAQSLTRWLLTAAAAVGVFELARRRLRPRQPRVDAAGRPLWAPFPVLAMLPPEDDP